ncbi:hypothetical protein [Jonesia quinghaiensis]|uniref:hypothetical protein n=1 Tax=Jonesia quinghaiensis TaxID=262806 RepID=UPI00146CC38E|nr:hypothetical protein [Jonesia quinghaiensis]
MRGLGSRRVGGGTRWWWRSAVTIAGGTLCGLLTACGPATEFELAFGPSDVEYAEFYTYLYANHPREVTYTMVADRQEITEWVGFFTDIPVKPSDVTAEEAAGLDADGIRFHLRDGTTYEVTSIFAGPGYHYLVWPDGTVMKTQYGVPSGFDGEAVNTAERPKALLP